MSSRKRKVYAIARGREGFQGIVDTWAQCSSIVQGVYGAKFKSFTDPEEAAKFAYGVDSPERKNQYEKKRRVDPPATVDLSQDDSEVGFEVVHTDGACENNGKATAIAGVGVYFGDQDIRNVSTPLQGPVQTNQRAEMTGILIALEILLLDKDGKQPVLVKTDSTYCRKGLDDWIHNWKRNGWLTIKRTPVLNKDLWILIDDRLSKLRKIRPSVDILWVKGHAGIPGNVAADKLAVNGAKQHH